MQQAENMQPADHLEPAATQSLDGRRVAYVDADNRGGGEVATAHLLGLGRSCIGTVTGPADMVAGVDRLAGYRAALEQAGRPLTDALVEEGDFTEEGGRRATAARRRLTNSAPRPTAAMTSVSRINRATPMAAATGLDVALSTWTDHSSSTVCTVSTNGRV